MHLRAQQHVFSITVHPSYYKNMSSNTVWWNPSSSTSSPHEHWISKVLFQPHQTQKALTPKTLQIQCCAEVYPPARYPKQGPILNGSPEPHRPKPRIWNETSRSSSRDRPIRKDDYQVSDELTRGPGVNTKIGHVDSASEPSGVASLGDKFNLADFPTEYEHAKFYVIKSYSKDDVHRCIKYDVWSSTLSGNKRLDAASHEAEVKASEFGKCPLFLLFSVNGSGQFVGVTEMIGKVDFNKTMDFWQLDKWSGFFPVRWHIIKDIPNSQLRHILLDSNENRPVTYTRDTQEDHLDI